MIFWRIYNNELIPIKNTDELGFEESEGLRIPDEYLEKQEFVVCRTAHGFGDWGLISAMPRLLKQKYPNCKVYVPSLKLLEKLFGDIKSMWPSFNNPLQNSEVVFKHNPYVDDFVDSVDGDIFHDHYRVYSKYHIDTPLVEQILKFWQFDADECKDSQPELYFSEEIKTLGDAIIKRYTDDKIPFGTILISDRFVEDDDSKSKINTVLINNHGRKWFYYMSKPPREYGFDFKPAMDMRHMSLELQMYIRTKARVNIGNQCGVLDSLPRYSNVYSIQRQFPLGGNFVRGENYV